MSGLITLRRSGVPWRIGKVTTVNGQTALFWIKMMWYITYRWFHRDRNPGITGNLHVLIFLLNSVSQQVLLVVIDQSTELIVQDTGNFGGNLNTDELHCQW